MIKEDYLELLKTVDFIDMNLDDKIPDKSQNPI